MNESAQPAAAGGRLRLKRQAQGLSQEQLAQASGVSRQAIHGVESGRWAPSLRVALAIARALDASVEDIFGVEASLPVVEAICVEPTSPVASRRVTMASVAGRMVAFPLLRHAATDIGFRPASAVVEATAKARASSPHSMVSARQISLLGPTVVIAGCDPALPLLSVSLSHLDPPLGLLWWPCGSDAALDLLRQGLVHVAGVHGPEPGWGALDAPALKPAANAATSDFVRVGFAGWREGLIVRPELSGKVSSLSDLERARVRLVNREHGSEARHLLDDERERLGVDLSHLPGYDTEVPGHLPVASAVAARLGDVGVGSEPAALAYELAFVPMATERYDLTMRRSDLETPEVLGVLQALKSGWLRAQLAALPGYDATYCGEEAASA